MNPLDEYFKLPVSETIETTNTKQQHEPLKGSVDTKGFYNSSTYNRSSLKEQKYR